MGDGLDYFDRPKYPACRDPRCSAVIAGIPHVVDETHRAVLDTLSEWRQDMRDMGDRPRRGRWCENPLCSREHYLGQGACDTDPRAPEHSGNFKPRALFLRAALRSEVKARKRRRLLAVSVGLVWCCGLGVLVALRVMGAV